MVGKIDGNTNDKNAQNLELERVKERRKQQHDAALLDRSEAKATGQDRLDVTLGSAINEILNPEQLQLDRQNKVDLLKALYQKNELRGKSGSELAESFAAGVNDEVDTLSILTSDEK